MDGNDKDQASAVVKHETFSSKNRSAAVTKAQMVDWFEREGETLGIKATSYRWKC